MRPVTFKIEEDLLEKLDVFALNHKLDRSTVIRMAIVEFLQRRGSECTSARFATREL